MKYYDYGYCIKVCLPLWIKITTRMAISSLHIKMIQKIKNKYILYLIK